MRTITIAARKGGVGKTTLATHLSFVAAAGGKPVLLFDTDPQRSLAWWWGRREADTPGLVECKAKDLEKILEVARREGVDTCVIDTPPHAEHPISEAMRVADLILVPTRPGPFDLAGVAATLELARFSGTPFLAVINAAPPPSIGIPSIVVEARQALVVMGAAVADVVISQRVAMSHAVIGGLTVAEYQPGGKAAGEVAALWAELQSRIGARA